MQRPAPTRPPAEGGRLIRRTHPTNDSLALLRRAVLRRALATADENDAGSLLAVLTDWKYDVDVALLRKLFRSDKGHLRWLVQEYARQMGKPEYAEFIKGLDDGPA